MHRQPLQKMLQRYLARYPEEAAVVTRICLLVDGAPDCFDRTCRPGHVTGSAWVLSLNRTQCLLVHHRKLDRWLQPGGHADGACQIEQVALRELREESGLTQIELLGSPEGVVPLDIDVHRIPDRFDASGDVVEEAHEHHDIRFLVLASADQDLVLSDESHALRWFTHSELVAVTREESVLRMMRKSGPHAVAQHNR